MTRFSRRGHWRTNQYGTSFWVREHGVQRDRWDRASYEFEMYLAPWKRQLSDSGVRCRTACYVNPNAKCPVCGASVFYYENAFGSRVYFDDLGVPWPKHPCTDNTGRKAPEPIGSVGEIQRRKKGLMIELLEAANQVRLSPDWDSESGKQSGWRLAVVIQVDRVGEVNKVFVETIDEKEPETVKFICSSKSPIFREGMILTVSNGHFSIVHPYSLQPVVCEFGGIVDEHENGADEIGARPHLNAGSLLGRGRTALIRREVANGSTKGTAERKPASRADFDHFGGSLKAENRVARDLGPVIRQYAREDVRKPADVAARLNSEGHRTALGAPWTSHLIWLLLQHLYNGTEYTRPKPKKPSHGQRKKKRKTAGRVSKRNATKPRAAEKSLEEKLSKLGRVMTKKQD